MNSNYPMKTNPPTEIKVMDLRDYFAANIITTQAERTMYQQANGFTEPTRFEDWIKCDAAVRYLKADALLAERDRAKPIGSGVNHD